MRACGREKSEALGTRIAERVSCEGRLVVHVRGYDLTRPPEVQRRGGGGQVTNPRSRTASARGLAGGAGLAHGSAPTRATAQGRPWTTSGAAGAPPSPPGDATAGGGGQVTNPRSRTAVAPQSCGPRQALPRLLPHPRDRTGVPLASANTSKMCARIVVLSA